MKKLIYALVLTMTALFGFSAAAQTVMAQPEPDFDNPRKVVISLNEKDLKRVNTVLNNVMNIQKAYGRDNVQLAVVAYGPGIWAVLKDSPVRARIESMQMYDIEFVACGNTLDAIKKDEGDTIKGVRWARAGLVEVIERRLNGWVDLKP
ncbi:MAG: DsrE family protein [Magnetovibrio sp.]|nr:DsrE family protein [Magnetovibrio sp.]